MFGKLYCKSTWAFLVNVKVVVLVNVKESFLEFFKGNFGYC